MDTCLHFSRVISMILIFFIPYNVLNGTTKNNPNARDLETLLSLFFLFLGMQTTPLHCHLLRYTRKKKKRKKKREKEERQKRHLHHTLWTPLETEKKKTRTSCLLRLSAPSSIIFPPSYYKVCGADLVGCTGHEVARTLLALLLPSELCSLPPTSSSKSSFSSSSP